MPAPLTLSAKYLRDAAEFQRSADTYAAFGYAASARVLQAKADRCRAAAEVQAAAELKRSIAGPAREPRWAKVWERRA